MRAVRSCAVQGAAGERLTWLSALPGCGEKGEGSEVVKLLRLDCLPKGLHFYKSLGIC